MTAAAIEKKKFRGRIRNFLIRFVTELFLSFSCFSAFLVDQPIREVAWHKKEISDTSSKLFLSMAAAAAPGGILQTKVTIWHTYNFNSKNNVRYKFNIYLHRPHLPWESLWQSWTRFVPELAKKSGWPDEQMCKNMIKNAP